MAAPKMAWARVCPPSVPITAQCTDLFPGNDIYTLVGPTESNDVPSASFTPTFRLRTSTRLSGARGVGSVNDAAAADAANKLSDGARGEGEDARRAPVRSKLCARHS